MVYLLIRNAASIILPNSLNGFRSTPDTDTWPPCNRCKGDEHGHTLRANSGSCWAFLEFNDFLTTEGRHHAKHGLEACLFSGEPRRCQTAERA